MQMSRQIHAWLSDWFDRLISLSAPLRPCRSDASAVSWATSMFTSPEALWHLAWLSCMSLLAAMAGSQGHRKSAGQEAEDSKDGKSRTLFR